MTWRWQAFEKRGRAKHESVLAALRSCAPQHKILCCKGHEGYIKPLLLQHLSALPTSEKGHGTSPPLRAGEGGEGGRGGGQGTRTRVAGESLQSLSSLLSGPMGTSVSVQTSRKGSRKEPVRLERRAVASLLNTLASDLHPQTWHRETRGEPNQPSPNGSPPTAAHQHSLPSLPAAPSTRWQSDVAVWGVGKGGVVDLPHINEEAVQGDENGGDAGDVGLPISDKRVWKRELCQLVAVRGVSGSEWSIPAPSSPLLGVVYYLLLCSSVCSLLA